MAHPGPPNRTSKSSVLPEYTGKVPTDASVGQSWWEGGALGREAYFWGSESGSEPGEDISNSLGFGTMRIRVKGEEGHQGDTKYYQGSILGAG